MALKADRNELDVDISFFYNEGTAEKGQVVVLDTVGSGAAMDQAQSKVKIAAATNALFPVGILLNDVVNLDLTRQHINWHKDEVQQGGKITILTKGTIVTDQISGTPTAGQTAYVADAGLIAGTQDGTAVAIGRFLSTKDPDDFCKIAINLP